MKFLMLLFLSLFANITTSFANPACVVCTVAIGASLEIARKLGISDNIVGLWAGALFALLGYWLILWFDKKNWHFRGRNPILMISSIAMIGFIYMGELVYSPQIIGFLYIDQFLLASLCGAGLYIFSQKFYAFMKKRNNGHAHFPFEKVVLPLALLFVVSFILDFYSL